MLKWALILLVVGAVLALFGFGGAAGLAFEGAQLLVVGFVALLIIGAILYLFRSA
ncbi:DUF1328 domain-containing protein [Phototrophicus methaneseepsis]|uniref:DUF1328 domain-containing protein n=1 Tax=Phototrophicus methaneseepsis TaxID=2710758 RepID=A0A7S8E7V5_9CHLR|nr:DUF1328 domain-containing protein [Phototrophicus methaneseepsis]QPC81969.1 DUF1328 domain-containing protein [Phototrophicus methaneseepsis]